MYIHLYSRTSLLEHLSIKDTSINRTLLPVQNATFMHLKTPELRTPYTWPNDVLIGGAPLCMPTNSSAIIPF